jgi:hypothetical protein
VSYRESLTPDELVQALLTGKVPQNRQAHFHVLLDETPIALQSSAPAETSAPCYRRRRADPEPTQDANTGVSSPCDLAFSCIAR